MINAIFATDDAGGMGFKGSLPWPHNKDDMMWFKSHTIGDVVVMGRKTWEGGMPKPLKGRHNWVISKSAVADILLDQGAEGVWNDDPYSLCSWLDQQHMDKNIWVIGGAALINALAGRFDRVYYTRIKGVYECDTFIDSNFILDGYESIYKDVREELEFNIYSMKS